MLRILLLVSLSSFIGCSTSLSSGPVKIRDVIPLSAGIEYQSIRVHRSELKKALDLGQMVNSLRLIPIFDSQRTGAIPEYRVFEVKPESSFSLLGVRNGDVLLAAHGFLLPDERQFPTYVSWLLSQKTTEIEIRRSGRQMILKIDLAG